MTDHSPYPPIEDYALIGDCHCSALVSRRGSIDWCCMPRMDSPSCFGRLLDWERGGYCAIEPVLRDGGRAATDHAYLDGTMVLTTTFTTAQGEVRLIDCFTMHAGGREDPHRQLLRIVEGVRGEVDLRLRLVPRFDYGEIKPWLRIEGARAFGLIGGATGLLVSGDADLQPVRNHDIEARFGVSGGQRVGLSIAFFRPEHLDGRAPRLPTADENDARLAETIRWWRNWSSQVRLEGPDSPSVKRSALVLKALTNAPTGAIAAAPTTSLPETMGGSRNWDYRFSWIRDSSFTVRALGEVGCVREADGFRRFIQRSAAGSAHDLQIMYGLGGERRLTELSLGLEGYRGSKPVRVGNAASTQLQLDAYGELALLSWRWHRHGHSPDDDYWRFLVDLVETAAERWRNPDCGLWEIRGAPRHFVHSKVLCWTAIDRGIALARECARRAPVAKWTEEARALRREVETRGYDRQRGVFTQSYDSPALDAALLLLPSTGFVRYDDERMVRTVDAIIRDLVIDGLVLRYHAETDVDGIEEPEGVFLCCSFWLAECLARQGRAAAAREMFDRTAATRSDLGLFSEEWDPKARRMLGNFPQGLTHLSHIAAAIALAEAEGYTAGGGLVPRPET